jgi:hypothetical protein
MTQRKLLFSISGFILDVGSTVHSLQHPSKSNNQVTRALCPSGAILRCSVTESVRLAEDAWGIYQASARHLAMLRLAVGLPLQAR